MRSYTKYNIGILTLILLVFLLQSCGLNNTKGQLVGVQGRLAWSHPQPYGMVNIPTGTFHMGQSDQDIIYALTSRPMQVSVPSFFMDDTEITNNEYRQFVYWVRDSIARKMLGEAPYIIETEDGNQLVNWKQKIDWAKPEVLEALASLFYQGNEIYDSKYDLDTRKLIYTYKWFDLNEAAKRKYLDNPPSSREKFFRNENVPIYPDTLCWIRDFTYSFNEPLTQHYFNHPAYDDYPVVGVNWNQAKAFCYWRTRYLNEYYLSIEMPYVNPFRLPSEAEFEYAARGGRDFSPYPWGGPYLRNSKGCFLANFKPLRGNYIEDGGFYPVKVTSYFPNDYGLYCMAGNVAEWTNDAYAEGITSVIDDQSPAYWYDAKKDETATMKRKAIRGGSWKDVGYFLQNGSRAWEYQDTSKSYIGFRCVMSYMGRSIKDKKSNY